jgi:hypothetical protein
MKRAAAFAALFVLASVLGPARMPKEAELFKRFERTATSSGGLSSLSGLSNRQLIEFMGPGKTKWERERTEENRDRRAVPDGFWELSPKDAALAFLEINQAPDDIGVFTLALDAGPDVPPGKGTLVYCYFSDRSYNDIRSYYYLRSDPERSYLALARTWHPGQVLYDFTRARTAYDFRFCELSYEEALHFVQVVWWLTKAGTKKAAGGTSLSDMDLSLSSADGQGRLTLNPEDGGRPIVKTGWIRVGSPIIWRRTFDGQACLNAASFAVQRILLDRLGRKWTDLEPGDADELYSIAWGERDLMASRTSYLAEMSGRILRLWSPDETQISSWHAAAAAQAGGDFGLLQLRPVLETIPKRLPPPQPPNKRPRTEDEFRAEFKKLRELRDPDEYREKVQALLEESTRRNEASPDSGRAAADELKDAVVLALRKIRAADDLPALKKWAKTRGEGSTWAAARILGKSPREYASVLESWMAKASPEEKSQILSTMFRGCPERAVEIAAKVSSGKRNDLRLVAAEILSNAGRIPGGMDRPDALIEIVRDKSADGDDRLEAIESLVPVENPGRFQGREVDDALLAILENETLKEPDPDCPLGEAAQALAWRKRIDLMGVLWRVLKIQEAGTEEHGSVLSAITYLARYAGRPEKEELARALATNLSRTGDTPITEILWSAWSADLRSLLPEIEKIATMGPGEEEAEGSGRYHLARKIVALWSEEDLATQGKLLIAFGLAERSFVESDALERGEQIREELGQLARAVTPDGLIKISNFLAWCESEVVGHNPKRSPEAEEKFVRLAREALGLSEHKVSKNLSDK